LYPIAYSFLVLDSSAKIPDGLLTRSLTNIGQFDECLSVDHPLGNFEGKHCMINVILSNAASLQHKLPIGFGALAVSIF